MQQWIFKLLSHSLPLVEALQIRIANRSGWQTSLLSFGDKEWLYNVEYQ